MNMPIAPPPDGSGLSGQVEVAVALAWAELLQRPITRRSAHFFDLGGNSLLAVQLALRMSQDFGVPVAQKLVFEKPVLSEFARAIVARQVARLPTQEVAALCAEMGAADPEDLVSLLSQ